MYNISTPTCIKKPKKPQDKTRQFSYLGVKSLFCMQESYLFYQTEPMVACRLAPRIGLKFKQRHICIYKNVSALLSMKIYTMWHQFPNV